MPLTPLSIVTADTVWRTHTQSLRYSITRYNPNSHSKCLNHLHSQTITFAILTRHLCSHLLYIIKIKKWWHMQRNLSQSGEPQRYSWEHRRSKRRRSQRYALIGESKRLSPCLLLSRCALPLGHQGGAAEESQYLGSKQPATCCLASPLYCTHRATVNRVW